MRKLLAVIMLCIVAPTSVLAERAWIQVRETRLRSQPKFYAPGGATLKYGQAVDKLSADGGWAEVKAAAGRGFLPDTVLSREQIVLSSQDIKKVKADTADVVLAGKGFSKEVEQQYKTKDAGARFDLVDRVERSARVSPGEVAEFVKSGGLNR